MDIDKAIRLFREQADIHGIALDSGDYKKGNPAHDKVIRALSEFRKQDDRGCAILTNLIKDENPHIRGWAATYLLPLDEDAAVQTLTLLQQEPLMRGFGAEIVLQEWRAGRLQLVC